ncbi:hypothetical protein B0T26DRAFT_484202 [Lasiosphaeria miniovina]|uniref:Uncharacterized protein n=1 Tax=Lasiosphaeria miniovina TaxID=1954250 RepID=A0AA40A0J3_9PEZI|nr:uncharacterized protein B0T26DRAFT_484202 [Lasiosphaeria miniovina]KAK0707087.1 hypothetical protein B0T26DRAFT_484202 [Lasiosphaeria miniovina]
MSLTFHSDKLPALSGIVKHLEPVMGPPTTYLAGIWKDQYMALQLGWFATLHRRRQEMTTPGLHHGHGLRSASPCRRALMQSASSLGVCIITSDVWTRHAALWMLRQTPTRKIQHGRSNRVGSWGIRGHRGHLNREDVDEQARKIFSLFTSAQLPSHDIRFANTEPALLALAASATAMNSANSATSAVLMAAASRHLSRGSRDARNPMAEKRSTAAAVDSCSVQLQWDLLLS